MQTLWPYLFRRTRRLNSNANGSELPDGDFLDLDWSTNGSGPIVIVLHGLEGSSDSKYVRGLLKAVHERGWRGVVMHFRGCSGEPNRLPRSYHSGETGDLAYVVNLLRSREPETSLFVVGFSLGGMCCSNGSAKFAPDHLLKQLSRFPSRSCWPNPPSGWNKDFRKFTSGA